VVLTDFTAQALGGGVQLAWHTASEVGSDRFDIERSFDGGTFATLGAVAARGTTTQAQAYSFFDKQVPSSAAVLYYRLRQVDLDGSAHYSPVRVVALAAGAATFEAAAYPNPWADALHVQLAGFSAEPVSLALYNAVGQLVRSHTTASAALLELPAVGGLPAGVYTLRVSQGSARQVLKLVH
jgi:hypothetical protein